VGSVGAADAASGLIARAVPSIRETSERVVRITEASRRQHESVLAIGDAIAALGDVAARQAAASEELTASAAALSERSEALAGTVSFFRLPDDGRWRTGHEGPPPRVGLHGGAPAGGARELPPPRGDSLLARGSG
jgi:methyl-accepting chemotaxis protein